MKIVYSFNKRGFEEDYWRREIAAASDNHIQFVPFNHDSYLDTSKYLRAQLLDNLYYKQHPGLLKMYGDLERVIAAERADVLLVDNFHPYHPEFLRNLDVYKALRTSDGPAAAYDRDFAYLHAYDHVLYHSPAYSRDLTMPEKLQYCGAKRHDFWPLALFDAFFDRRLSEPQVAALPRDIDIIFVGALYPDKMPLLAAVKKAFGRRFQIHGLASFKRNAYFNLKYGLPQWVRPIRFENYVPLYQRAKIGINSHLRGKYTVGSYRLYDLPGNGVAQISDGGEYIDRFYIPGREIDIYEDAEQLIGRLDHYLTRPDERQELAMQGWRRVMKDHRIGTRLRQLRELLAPAVAGH
ncbi:MAG TPA: glycosyltransferase [Lysobacter sp.]|jgi:spore maturation protein CgeB|nr:glycosyltransferase [Lysobacter sp.]